MMIRENPRPARRVGYRIFRALVCFPVVCFCGALVTDLAYARTADMMWADFSDWLLAVGMAFAVLAAIVGIIQVLADRLLRTQRQVWLFALGILLVLILALFDNLIHSRDAWTSVVPTGLALSAVTVAVMLITAWFGSARITVDRVGAEYSGARR